MRKPNLTTKNVFTIFTKCFSKEHENVNNLIMVEGINIKAKFNIERLKEHTPMIIKMLDELPNQFKANKGGGWSFLNMCNDKNGRLWSGYHPTMDQLICLGNAIGKLKFNIPRNSWHKLPGGMPYIVIF